MCFLSLYNIIGNGRLKLVCMYIYIHLIFHTIHTASVKILKNLSSNFNVTGNEEISRILFQSISFLNPNPIDRLLLLHPVVPLFLTKFKQLNLINQPQNAYVLCCINFFSKFQKYFTSLT